MKTLNICKTTMLRRAVRHMPRYGFNGQLAEMKIFILFVMRHVVEPITLDEMAEMVLIDDNMNYFAFSQ